MKTVPLLIVLVVYIAVTAIRLPAWHSNKTIWVSGAISDPDDPWCLNNAANYTRNAQAFKWLINLTDLNIPDWMPLVEREPYYVGFKGLIDTLQKNGDFNDAANYESKMVKVLTNHVPSFTYIATEKNNDPQK